MRRARVDDRILLVVLCFFSFLGERKYVILINNDSVHLESYDQYFVLYPRVNQLIINAYIL